MTPRDTRTGGVLESMILPALSMGGYSVKKQVIVGTRPGGGHHKIDVIAMDKMGCEYLISLKWQQVGGTAEQKVPFEVICLSELMKTGRYKKAYLVLGGGGWSLRDYYITGGLSEHLVNSELVNIVSLETFIALANDNKL